MKKSCLWMASLALCLLSLQTGPAQATSGLKNGWKNFYPEACQDLVDDDCTQPGDLTSADEQDSWGSIKILFR